MKRTISITSIVDRAKAMGWLKTNRDMTLVEASVLLKKPLPVKLDEESQDILEWLKYTYAACDNVMELLEGIADGELPYGSMQPPPCPDWCGFTHECIVQYSQEEIDGLREKKAKITEIFEADAWLKAQPEDIKRKVAILIRGAGPTA